MRRKSSKQLFSVLMAATMVMSGISIPVNASQVDDAVVRSVLTKTEAEASESREINFNEGWKFHYGDVENAEKKDFDDSDLAKWGNLKLPHDFSITQEPSNSNVQTKQSPDLCQEVQDGIARTLLYHLIMKERALF